MIKIDFGSGYNPQKGYSTCDITFAPYLDYVYDIQTNKILNLSENTVSEFRLKNVLHHCDNIKNISECLHKYLEKDGIIKIIEPLPEKYNSNRSLDIFWYRYIYPRYEIMIPPINRIDYVKIFSEYFELIQHNSDDIYDYYIFKK